MALEFYDLRPPNTCRRVVVPAQGKTGPIATQMRPDGYRQPIAEAWVLIKINAQLTGGFPQNERFYWP